MRRGRLRWKNFFAAVVAVVVLIGAISAIVSIAGRKSTAIRKSSFSIGALDEDGAFREYNQAIVSDYFECQGLTVEPTDKASGTYRVFYYTEDKKLLGKTDEMNPMDGVYEKGDDFMLAKYARVVITPDIPADLEGSDFRIRFWEVVGYASGYTVTVDKQQKFKYSTERDLMNSAEMKTGKTYLPTSNEYWSAKKDVLYDAEGKHCSEPIELSDSVTEVFVRCLNSVDDNLVYSNIYFFDEEGDVVKHHVFIFEPGTTELYSTIWTNGAKYFAVEGYYWHEWSVFVEK